VKLPALCAALIALAACSAPDPTVTPPVPSLSSPTGPPAPATQPPPTMEPLLAVIPYRPDNHITGAQPPACVARAHGMLPDPACTPGAVGAVTHADGSIGPASSPEVCNVGFSTRHRPPSGGAGGSTAHKRAAMAAYHVPAADIGRTEYDHLVPLSLGGADDVRNLWPQVSDIPARGWRNSKDAVEQRLWTAVCVDQKVALTDAQAQMSRDWTAAEKFFGLS
jgi:hypothetical protein